MNYFKKTFLISVLLLKVIFILGCVEEFQPNVETFEDILVVEATITNESKFQKVVLSRTFEFNSEQRPENGADVSIVDNLGNTYTFNNDSNGTYISDEIFKINSTLSYTLRITTANGREYSSTPQNLTSETAQINDVTFKRTQNSNDEDGIEILIDSFDPENNGKYYRFEMEETQRIIVPFWGPREIIIVSDSPPFKVTDIPNTNNNRVCYKTTVNNSKIIQGVTVGLAEDRLTQFPVRFISSTDSIIRDRYSVLVKQFVQSFEAYNYYRVLNEFSISENIFSENQPGFIEGNIKSISNSNEKVIGFFEVAAVSSKRLFINFTDAFPGVTRPPFFAPCQTSFPDLVDPNSPDVSPLIDLLKSESVTYLITNEDFFGNPVENPPYEVVSRECGDCTLYGSNIVPDFWIDE